MNKIQSPLSQAMQGSLVGDLQTALLLLLSEEKSIPLDPRKREELLQALAGEQDQQVFGDVTAKLVGLFQEHSGLDATGFVDQDTASALNAALFPEEEQPQDFPYLVRGQVLYRAGLPIRGLTVRAFHRELRTEIELGKQETDQNGNFEIYYDPNRIEALASLLNHRPPDVFVRVFAAESKTSKRPEILVESATRFSAQRVVKFRLSVDGGPTKTWSEFQQLTLELKPYLGKLRVAELVQNEHHQDVTLLAGKLGQAPGTLAAYIAAHKIAAEVRGNPEVFYALIRKGLPANLPELLATPSRIRSQAILSAVQEGIAPGRLVKQLGKIRQQFERQAVSFAAADQPTANHARLGAILNTAIADQRSVNALVAKILSHSGPAKTLWADLQHDPQCRDLVPEAQVTLQLTALTGRHLPLVKTLLQQQRQEKVPSIAKFAAFSENDWLALINAQEVPEGERVPPAIPGKNAEEKARLYAATLSRIVADTMPTQVLAYRTQSDENQPNDVRTFWANVTAGVAGFELGRGPVRPYLEKHPALMDGVEDKGLVVEQLEETQRLYNLTPAYDEQQALRGAGITSSLVVSRLGQGAFLQKMLGVGIPAEKAVLMYEKATRLTAASLELVTQFSPSFNRIVPRALPNPSVKQIPNLDTLFGSLNLCGCEECRSVHSPAAYFADLLAFLADRTSTKLRDAADPSKGFRSALDVLFERRPDLGEIELTCANANTVLPYTDLINEIVERRIAPFTPFDLPAEVEAQLNSQTISAVLRDAFANQQILLSPTARVTIGAPSARWSISDGSTLYSIVTNGPDLTVTGAWPQTGAAATSLAAVPEHRNPAAYAVLRSQVFPWSLPLDMAVEEIRVFLDHLGSPRHELMGVLHPGGPSGALDDDAICSETLGLSHGERQCLTGTWAPPPQAWESWGLAQNGNHVSVFDTATQKVVDQPLGWLESLAWVRETLRRSGLVYEELVRVLGCAFVNPNQTVRIASADPQDLTTCDTAKLTLTNLTAATADRLSRFVRLWRKVGGSPEDLDLVLVTLCGSQLDDVAIKTLSHVMRLRTAFGREIPELIPLWGAIPTQGQESLYQRLFQNPTVLTPVDSAFALDGANELAILTSNPVEAKVSKHAAPILAALRLSASDLAALQAAGIAGDDTLSQANLAALYRHAFLAQCVEISIPNLLLLKSLAGINPFNPGVIADTQHFVDIVGKIRQSGLNIDDIGYLLFHLAPDTAAMAPPLGAPGELIADIRRQLKLVRDATEARLDPAGQTMGRELAALRWPAEMIDEIVAVVGGTAVFTTALNPPPAGFAVPADFASRLVHDPDNQTISLTGSLTTNERDGLKGAFAEANYKAAIEDLFLQPRLMLQKRMRAYTWPSVSAPLAALPAGLAIPAALKPRISFDPVAGRLTFDGTMNDADKQALDALSDDPPYLVAVAALLTAADAYGPAGDNVFVTAAVADALFEQPQPGDRLTALLALLLQRRRREEGTRLVVRLLADAVGLKDRLANRLLTQDLPHPDQVGKTGIDSFLEDPFAASDLDEPPSETVFPAPFKITVQLMKIAALVGAMKLSDRLIDWLGLFAPTVPQRDVPWGGGALQAGWLSLTELPAQTEAVDPKRFAAWLRLCDLRYVGVGLPGGDATAEAVLSLARQGGITPTALLTQLATLTGWDTPVDVAGQLAAPELEALASAIGLVLPQDLRDEEGLLRLREAVRHLHRLGTHTAQALAWAQAEPDGEAGIAARQAVQSSYPAQQWPDAIRPLEEKLREQRRAGLVAHLVVRPDPIRGETWDDSNGLFAHLLIDVETQPVVLTSRLKQAIGSVQLFVQRCLMNLEPDVTADGDLDIGWRQWPWMKHYRVWEANRKIFLYPENWIEPELRDDKSPFFVELENALLQSDVTAESAEQAYCAYLARLDEVANLDIAGVYHQPGEGGAPDEYHVFARTHADPPTYFYRKWVGQARWTAWQRLELDIPAGQILPLVWNRRLYLFWPIFTNKTRKPQTGGSGPDDVVAESYFEIQLAWSEQRQGRWGPKKTTPSEATIESEIRPDGDPPNDLRSTHIFRAMVSGNQLQIWHETPTSTAAKKDKYGTIIAPATSKATQGWLFSGCNGRVSRFSPTNLGVYPPPNTNAHGMGYEERPTNVMQIPSDNFPLYDNTLQLPKSGSGLKYDIVLRRTPGAEGFRLLPPHQEPYLKGQLPFFFQDDTKSFLILPKERRSWMGLWTRPERMDPAFIDTIDQIYYQPDPIPDPIGPIAQQWDPVPIVRHQATALGTEPAIAVANGLAKPVRPAVASGALMKATAARKSSLVRAKGTKVGEVVASGERGILNLGDYLSTDHLFNPLPSEGYAVLVRRYEFRTHYHPYICPMFRDLNLLGLSGLLRRSTQLQRATPFESRYAPTSLVVAGDPAKKEKYPVEDIDFSFDGAYSGYNWELFFHAPLLIACKLMQNQRFEEAQQWFHTIFDPTDVSSESIPARYWRTKPFFEQQDYLKNRIDKLLESLSKGVPDEDLSRQLNEWVENPFRPFAVARVRTVAFQKTVVMKYLDNLISWGDQLFLRDTIESLNEATQLYILAAEILGPRPPVIPPRARPVTHTFNTLTPQFASLTNELTTIESVLTSPRVDAVLASPDSPPPPIPQMLYFCVPANDKLLTYWDTVADRLFKIRNSLNLAGIRRTLPLFEPPIDPMVLVKAAAAGVDLGTAIADQAAPAPLYRFQVWVQKAVELCQDVKALGSALLGALERRDAEELAQIQAIHEVALLKRLSTVKDEQIKEAETQITALEAARELAAERYRHYQTLLGSAPTIPTEGTAPADAKAVAGANTMQKDGVRMIAQESNDLNEMAEAASAEETASDWDARSNFSYYIPEFHTIVSPWGVGLDVEFGGRHVGPALTAIANLWRSSAAERRHKAQKAGRLAEFIMRAHNWKLEANLASREISRIDKDLAAARIRESLAIKERDNHLKQITEKESIEEFMRTKYTNRQLYDWMVSQISAVYFQAYQLAYNSSRRAEKAFQRDLALADTNFIRFGYWDSLRKGLLAGERLLHDVRRMEMAYLDQNNREYEITKNISLATLYPEGLLALREQGACFVDLPEAVFDLDHPGHYLRRIKAITISIPCVTGPYTSVACKLTLLANRTRVNPTITSQYSLTGPDDSRFTFNAGGVRSVVTSTGREDPAAFELNLQGDRYLPFEGAGVISSWRLELPPDFRAFDYRTIADVVLQIRYTAREGGEILRDAAAKALTTALKTMELDQGQTGLFRGFSGRHDYPDAWQVLAHGPDGPAGQQRLSLPLTAERLPFFTRGRSVKVTRVLVALVLAPDTAYDDEDPVTLILRPPSGAPANLTLALKTNRGGNLPMAEVTLPAPVLVPSPKTGDGDPVPWQLELGHISANLARSVTVNGADLQRIDTTKVSDIAFLCAYTI
jgi:hypothetical protein